MKGIVGILLRRGGGRRRAVRPGDAELAVLVATFAFAKGLVALGIVVLMRGRLVSFGQGMFFAPAAMAPHGGEPLGSAMPRCWSGSARSAGLLGLVIMRRCSRAIAASFSPC